MFSCFRDLAFGCFPDLLHVGAFGIGENATQLLQIRA